MRTLVFIFVWAGCGSNNTSTKGDMGDASVPGDDSGVVVPDMTVLPDLLGQACITGLTTITITPANSMVTLDGMTAAPITFTATGTFSDGHMAPVDPSQLYWRTTRTDATDPGTIANGILSPNPKSGGTVTISATDGCVTGTTTVVFALQVTLGTPSNAGDWSGTPTTSPSPAPAIVYPTDQTRFPRNIYRTLFQWHTQGFTEFRLTFAGPGSTVTVYTDGAHMLCAMKTPAAGCWEADEAAWSFIAGSNAGQTVTWTLDALDRSGATPVVRRAAPITIGFSSQDVVGAIFYWSTTAAGVRRANISDAVPENYIAAGTTYTNPNDTIKCVACHVVSRDGKYLAAPVASNLTQSLWINEVTVAASPTPLVRSVPNTNGHGFATISPDDSKVMVAWGGVLWTVKLSDGSYIDKPALGALKATHPDWSPDNSQVVFATAAGDAPGNAALAVLPYNNPGWGTPKTLLAAAGLSNLFPQFSPDGKWIAFSRGKGGHGDLTARLQVLAATGGTAVDLTRANDWISNRPSPTPVPQTENSQPTWAPPGDLLWVAFNSQREYGVVQKQGTQQIWVAAIEPSKLGTGKDPSYPAFRLQFQGLTENNHRAYWTLDVRQPTDGGVAPPMGDMARVCIAADQPCQPGLDYCCDAGFECDTTNGTDFTCSMPVN
jgi:hypothetical protein